MGNLEFWIAYRYLRYNVRNGFVSVAAWFAFVGIMLGVAALIIVSSVMNGFRKEFSEILIGFNGNVTVLAKESEVEKCAGFLKNHKKIERILNLKDHHAMLVAKKNLRAILVYGVDCDDLKKHKIVSKNIISGNNIDLSKRRAIIGSILAKKMGNIKVGDKVEIIVPEFDESGLGVIPMRRQLIVSGIFCSGMHEYDSSVVFISRSTFEGVFERKINTFSIFLKKGCSEKEFTQEILQKIPDITVFNWQNSNSAFMRAIMTERNVMFVILTLIVLVASFNIISSMVMLVRDKEKSIAILKGIGIQNLSIVKIFLIVGMSIGLLGTIIGCVVGVSFAANIENIRHFLEFLLDVDVFSAEVYYLAKLPFCLNWSDVIVTIFISLLLTLIAAIYPALRASRLNPIEVLRHG